MLPRNHRVRTNQDSNWAQKIACCVMAMRTAADGCNGMPSPGDLEPAAVSDLRPISVPISTKRDCRLHLAGLSLMHEPSRNFSSSSTNSHEQRASSKVLDYCCRVVLNLPSICPRFIATHGSAIQTSQPMNGTLLVIPQIPASQLWCCDHAGY